MKYLRYVPNVDHSLKGSDAREGIVAFYRAVVNNSPLPKFTWEVQTDGAILIHTETRPLKVTLWQATNPSARDFRLESIGPAYKKTALPLPGQPILVNI